MSKMITQVPFSRGCALAAYLRDSGHEEQELSIAQQEDAIRAWCAENGYILTRVFKDEARPGSTTAGREAFQAMIAHFRNPNCQEKGIIIWKYSRFARDIDDAQFYKADLRRRGYEIYSLKDTVPQGTDGRFFEAAIDWMNARYLEDLSSDIKRGLKFIVQQYGAVPGTPPIGFKREPIHIGQRRDGTPHILHRWVPDPETIPLVRLAWQMRAAGASYRQIHAACRLFQTKNSYTTFYANRLYIGELVFADLVIPNYCEPIIDEKTWHAVQTINQRNTHNQRLRAGENSNHPRRLNSNYLLSGLVYCAKCGSLLNGHTVRRKNLEPAEYYLCNRHHRIAGCDARAIPKNELENAVLETLKTYLLDPKNLDNLQNIILSQYHQDNQHVHEQRTILTQRLNRIRKNITNLIDILAEHGRTHQTRSVLQKLQELESEEIELQTQLIYLPEAAQSIEPKRLSTEQLQELADTITAALHDSPITVQRQILAAFIEKIETSREGRTIHGIIHYYFPLEISPSLDLKKN